jgi:hypothetical protein
LIAAGQFAVDLSFVGDWCGYKQLTLDAPESPTPVDRRHDAICLHFARQTSPGDGVILNGGIAGTVAPSLTAQGLVQAAYAVSAHEIIRTYTL